MRKFFLGLSLGVFTSKAWACPYCYNLEKSKPGSTLIIIGVFILLTYIPFFIIFRAAKKYDPKRLDADK